MYVYVCVCVYVCARWFGILDNIFLGRYVKHIRSYTKNAMLNEAKVGHWKNYVNDSPGSFNHINNKHIV